MIAEAGQLRILMALAGAHRVQRGAETAFEALAAELGSRPGIQVTLIGSGEPRLGLDYRFVQVKCRPRERFERWPKVAPLRDSYVYEEMTFAPRLWRAYDPRDFDLSMGCTYPFTNWVLRRKQPKGRPLPHVYVTQNGDWPVKREGLEYKWFGCDGLVCTRPSYYEAHRDRYRSVLIPNGVDIERYKPGESRREQLGLPKGQPVIVMVNALAPSKRVPDGIRAAAQLKDVFLLVLGDGPMREEVDRVGQELMPGRFARTVMPRERMPEVWRSADAMLHMDQDEPFGNVYIEAMACGLPVVAHDTPTTRWITEGTEFLVDTNNQSMVCDALRAAMTRKWSKAQLAGRNVVERRFSWKVVGDQYEKFLREVQDAVTHGKERAMIGVPPV